MRALMLIILIVLAAVTETAAMDALWGRVISIDRRNHEMVVTARPMTDASAQVGQDGEPPKERTFTVKFGDTQLPPCVAEGTVVRLWGEFSRGEPGVFTAAFVRGAGRRSWGYDPTGVRQRIGRGRGAGPWPPGGRHGERSCSVPQKP